MLNIIVEVGVYLLCIVFSILPTDLAYFWLKESASAKCSKLFCPVYVRINRIFR